jgi:3-hydroxyacyl-[acyl-carrier-protein] dehydratase
MALDTIDIQRFMELMPHRYPFLLVDKIKAIQGDERGIGVKNVTANEPQFTGHFPERPIFPGVLLVEGMAQTAGAMCVAARPIGLKPKAVYFMTMDNVKFRKPVVPGDTVEYHMVKTNQRRNMWWYHGEAMVDGQKVAEADLSAMLVD